MVHQHFRLAASFTVAENLVLGHRDAADRGLLLEPRVVEGRIAELSRRYRMPVNPRARIWQLSVGEQQRVEILKVLYRGARILILDEPTSQLTPQEADDLFQTLRLMAAEKRRISVISHKLADVMAVSNRVTVLRRGKVIGTVMTGDTNTRELARMMVGRDVVFTQKKQGPAQAERQVALELRQVSATGDLGSRGPRNVNLTVHAGAIGGVGGGAGNGPHELAEVVTGMRRRTSGQVIVTGRPARGSNPLEAIRRGIAYVPDDRLGTGVAPSLSVAENLVLKAFRRPPISTQGFLHPRRIRANAVELMRRFNIAASSRQTPARVLAGGGPDPVATGSRLLGRGFFAPGAMSATLVTATPLLLTGLAAAAAFRMQTWNIGAEGQLYLGAVGASGIGIALRDQSPFLVIPAMILAGIVTGAAWAAIPGVLRAYTRTNEIITSLMLNYVAGLLMSYLIFDSHSYWRDLSTFTARVFPQGKYLPDAASWPNFPLGGIAIPLGFVLGMIAAAVLWVIYTATRFGFEARVIGDSRAAAHYAGIRPRRKIVAVMALSGALAGIGGASEIGDFRHVSDPRGLQQASFGYAAIVVPARARLNPFAVIVVAILLGGLSNAGFSLRGATFPDV